MIPTCISDDVEAAKAVNRRTLTRYTMLPNYRNYWKEAGYIEEMTAIETAIAAGRQNDIPALMSDRWLADATLFGPASGCATGSPRGRRPASRPRSWSRPRPSATSSKPSRKSLRRSRNAEKPSARRPLDRRGKFPAGRKCVAAGPAAFRFRMVEQ